MANAGYGKRNRIASLIILAVLAGFAFYVNRAIQIKGLYMDDLYMWSCYGEQSVWDFAFPIGTSTRFRPVYWLATYLQMMIVGTHVTRFVAFNIICNIGAAWLLWYIASRLSGCIYVGAGVSVCYLASRFAYYQIGQALGLMETMALVFAVTILYLLLRYMLSESPVPEMRARGADRRLYYPDKGRGYFITALVLYFLLAFTHERYIVLFPLFYYVLLVRFSGVPKEARRHYLAAGRGLFAAPAVVLIMIVLIRSFAIGKALPAGTGGTEVTETFHLAEAIRYAFSQVLYIFGVNDGPEHLNGLPWEQTPPEIKRMTKISILLIGLICIAFALLLLKELVQAAGAGRKPAGRHDYRGNADGFGGPAQEEPRKLLSKHLCVSFLFVLFILLCIGCSSVTIRVEMRWIYVSYAAALLFAAYMIGEVSEHLAGNSGNASESAVRSAGYGSEYQAGSDGYDSEYPAEGGEYDDEHESGQPLHPVRILLTLLFAGYMVLSVYCNIFYRGYFKNLYFWPNQLRMNSLAEQTVEKYGTEGIFGKDIYILENTYQMTDFYGRTFFKPYDPEKKAEGTTVHFVDSAAEVPEDQLLRGQAIVLKEVPEENAYEDITEQCLQQEALQDRV